MSEDANSCLSFGLHERPWPQIFSFLSQALSAIFILLILIKIVLIMAWGMSLVSFSFFKLCIEIQFMYSKIYSAVGLTDIYHQNKNIDYIAYLKTFPGYSLWLIASLTFLAFGSNWSDICTSFFLFQKGTQMKWHSMLTFEPGFFHLA